MVLSNITHWGWWWWWWLGRRRRGRFLFIVAHFASSDVAAWASAAVEVDRPPSLDALGVVGAAAGVGRGEAFRSPAGALVADCDPAPVLRTPG